MRIVWFGLGLVLMVACSGFQKKPRSSEVCLTFSIHQERSVYEQTDYGEAPQFAIWLENKETGVIRTVFVTRRTATGDFEGKAECPVSLPAWIAAFRKETGRTDFPTPREPAETAVTGATPQVREINVKVKIPRGSNWYYFVEMNVSGDYNIRFPSICTDGMIDSQGNGQPSIIFKGEIPGKPGECSIPLLIGRTEQFYFLPEILSDLEGIETAKEVFSMIKVTCNEGVP